VALGVDGDSLRLTIRDDGVGGVDSARGTGLVGLTDRVQALGGSLEIQSNTGTGTRLVASFPLSGDAARDGDGVAAATAPERSSDVIASSRASRSTD
jgi:glucose-6-phosphate-specific signal transduction histidine kinase